MSASPETIEAVMREMGCAKGLNWAGEVVCNSPWGYHAPWTDRGCAVSVRIADAAVDAEASR